MGSLWTRRQFVRGAISSAIGLRWSQAADAAPQCNGTIRFVHGEDRRPISWVGPSGESRGLKIDVIDILCRVVDVCPLHQCRPWARALQSVYSDDADGVLAVPSAERSEWIRFGATALIEDEALLFYRRDNPLAAEIAAIRSIEDMRRFKVTDSFASAWASINATEIVLDLVPNQQIAFRKLINQRTDIAIINRLAVSTVIRLIGGDSEVDWVTAPVNPLSRFHIGLRRNLPNVEALLYKFDLASGLPEIRSAISAATAKYL